MLRLTLLLILMVFSGFLASQWFECHGSEAAGTGFAQPVTSESSPAAESVRIRLPVLGEIDPTQYALPVLAVLLGLVDGFNPCAMWALVYLISLIIGLNDRAKIWLLVGSFVLASGILYFLFMTAWLGAFLIIGYYRPLTMGIGVVTLGFGLASLVEVIRSKGPLTCKIGNEGTKKKTQEKMKAIVCAPLTFATLAAIIGLAFLVSSIEFLCSSAIPAVFTHVLSISGLTWLEYYGYILLYDFFFMLDDLVIFSLAAFAISSSTSLGERYARVGKTVSGLLLTFLGGLLLFTPELLR